MIRVNEMVLPGHPDKFCDQIADAIIAECHKIDNDAYGQVEVSVWSDRIWLSGGICTRRSLSRTLQEIVVETGNAIGYTGGNHIDAGKYQIENTVCQLVGDPVQWSEKVNDQSIVIGWAGYDAATNYLTPEHFLAHLFRDKLTESCRSGHLRTHGPDGKLMVRLREDSAGWSLEHILVTLQQRENVEFMAVNEAIVKDLHECYSALQDKDGRWCSKWPEIDLMINPNGPLLNGGSDGDNGQTGRKLVMDFYGPRIAIGGGALSGKHLSHIDRIGAYAARHAAVLAVSSGAKECRVGLAYAPNRPDPLDISIEAMGRCSRPPKTFFNHAEMVRRYPANLITADIGRGVHFFDRALPWNRE
ncbi:MAG: methionine adenosyltransferase domain-containing protein [Candidatus Riflebacteria bacterium]|nr:methionine adenosyltransferase domain-containing protein [Candidatus Riflebacteria bacterium]